MLRARLILAWCLLTASIVGWPLSALTIASDEPQFILGLSWLAIILTSIDVLSITDVRRRQERRSKKGRKNGH